jgi:hypothetical protein
MWTRDIELNSGCGKTSMEVRDAPPYRDHGTTDLGTTTSPRNRATADGYADEEVLSAAIHLSRTQTRLPGLRSHVRLHVPFLQSADSGNARVGIRFWPVGCTNRSTFPQVPSSGKESARPSVPTCPPSTPVLEDNRTVVGERKSPQYAHQRTGCVRAATLAECTPASRRPPMALSPIWQDGASKGC